MTDPRISEFDREWKEGDRARAKEIAQDYVADNRLSLSALLEDKSLEELVQMVTGYRNEGREDDRIICDMWLLSEFAPQNITASLNLGGQAAVEAAEAILKETR